MNTVVLGAPGSGKSTQAKLLSDFLRVPFLSMGEVLREKADEVTGEGQRIKRMLEEGELVDDKTFFEVFRGEISKLKYKKGVVLDGLPRTLKQAYELESLIKIERVIYLDVPDSVSLKRLMERERADDSTEVILHRLKLYHEETEPVLDFYRSRGLVVEVDGTGSVEKIFGNIKINMESS